MLVLRRSSVDFRVLRLRSWGISPRQLQVRCLLASYSLRTVLRVKDRKASAAVAAAAAIRAIFFIWAMALELLLGPVGMPGAWSTSSAVESSTV